MLAVGLHVKVEIPSFPAEGRLQLLGAIIPGLVVALMPNVDMNWAACNQAG
jgi:hypothetical protein